MRFKLLDIDIGDVIAKGELLRIVTTHGHEIHEYKTYFNGLSDYERPVVTFTTEDSERITVELKITKKGYSGGLVVHGYKYGVNLNRVMNKRNRWGLTVWREVMTPAAPVTETAKDERAVV